MTIINKSMIDPQILKITDERIKIEIEQQNQHLRDEIKRVSAEMAARGLVHSGAMIGSISKLYKQYIKNQAHLIWQTLFRFITTSGRKRGSGLEKEGKGGLKEKGRKRGSEGKGGLVMKNKPREKLKIKRGCMGLRVALPALITKSASREV